LVTRCTRLFSDIWVQQIGGVPSGCFNTSHMDSWIMGLYFYLFCVYQLMNASEQDQEGIEMAILAAHIVTYGDDHVYNKGESEYAGKISGHAFASFMKRFFDVDIRDLYDGISFVTQHKNGMICRRGVCLLKHFFVENPRRLIGHGQPDYLPFRETFDFVVRAVWGRESRYRDLVDVLLSVIGHAYGTYGANEVAYYVLSRMYVRIITVLDLPSHALLSTAIDKMSSGDLRKMRQMNVSSEDILSGFPSLDSLRERNIYDQRYHETRKEYIYDSWFWFD